jgi:hypothetical protein
LSRVRLRFVCEQRGRPIPVEQTSADDRPSDAPASE